MKNIVVLTGAGISAESGIKTFRDSGGVWEEYDIMEVASIDGWYKNPKLVLNFYNARRRQLAECQPNPGHLALAALEKFHNVQIVTQNVDDLHERAGSTDVLHLHGELKKARSTGDDNYIITVENELNWGEKCPKGFQMRPHIVWFGEAVPLISRAIEYTEKADVLIVIGTSLAVYPAAGLLDYAPNDIPKYYIDPNAANITRINNLTIYRENASTGVPKVVEQLIGID